MLHLALRKNLIKHEFVAPKVLWILNIFTVSEHAYDIISIIGKKKKNIYIYIYVA